MRILKVLNNNVVTSIDVKKNETIIMGKGLGFQKKAGDMIDEALIEKVFILDDQKLIRKIEDLIRNIPEEFLEITGEIIDYAKEIHKLALRDNLYLSLTDHISFAVERFKQGMTISNIMLPDIKYFYKEEFKIGQKALAIIAERTGVNLPEDEAGFIALHIINASAEKQLPDSYRAINLANEMMNIVEKCYDTLPDHESLSYFRFANHLKFLAQKILTQTDSQETDISFFDIYRHNFPKEIDCANKINEYVHENHQVFIPNEEFEYLIVSLRMLFKKEVY